MNRPSEWKVLGREVSGDLAVEVSKLNRREYSLKIGRIKRDEKGEFEAVLPFLPVRAKVENGSPLISFPDEIVQLIELARQTIETDVAYEFDRWQSEREAEEIKEFDKARGRQRKPDARAIEEAKAEAHPGYVPRGSR